MNVEDVKLFPSATLHPIIFEEVYVKERQNVDPEEQKLRKKSVKRNKDCHLVVMVHGY